MPVPQHLLDQIRRLSPEIGPAACVSLGAAEMDGALSGGLKLGALHEIYAAQAGDAAAAMGFTLGLAIRAAKGKPVLWARQDMLDTESGHIYAPGLAEMGLAPGAVVLVRARDAEDVLKAGEDAVRCAGLGAVLIEPWGAPRQLNLTASRRLVLAAAASGVTALMLRSATQPLASATETRWRIAAAPSHQMDAEAPGFPAFDVTLLRRRGGASGQRWFVEWNRDRLSFTAHGTAHDERSAAALSRPVVSLPGSGAATKPLRRTG